LKLERIWKAINQQLGNQRTAYDFMTTVVHERKPFVDIWQGGSYCGRLRGCFMRLAVGSGNWTEN